MHKLAYTLMLIGGLNWLIWGLFSWEIGYILGGPDAIASRVIYVVIGLGAVYELATHRGRCKDCEKKI